MAAASPAWSLWPCVIRMRSSSGIFFAESGHDGFDATHGSARIRLPPGDWNRNVECPSQVNDKGISRAGGTLCLRPHILEIDRQLVDAAPRRRHVVRELARLVHRLRP